MDRAAEDGERRATDGAADGELPQDGTPAPAALEQGGERLFDLLTAEGSELAPLHYQLFERRPPRSGVPLRIAASAWYHTPTFFCFPFHKPISRCRRYDEA